MNWSRSRAIGVGAVLAVCAATAAGLALRPATGDGSAPDVASAGTSSGLPSDQRTASAAADGGLRGQGVVGAAGARIGGTRTSTTTSTSSPKDVTRTPAHAYYVNCISGSDSADGSPARPWRSFKRVSATTFPVDSGVFLARGCTWQEPLEVFGRSAGTVGLVVTAYGSGAAPVISGAGQSAASAVSLLSDRVELSSVVVTGATRYGIQLFGAGDVVRDTVISDSGIGVRTIGTGDVIDQVTVHDLHMIVNTRGGNDDFGAVGFDVESADVELSNSSCTNCRASSYDYGYDGGFVEIWNHGDNLYAHDNLASNTNGFLEIGGSAPGASARNVRILSNTMNEMHGGFFIHNTGDFGISSDNILVQANLINNRQASTAAVFAGYLGSLSLDNNVIISNGPVAFTAPWRHSGNTFYVKTFGAVGFTPAASETVKPFTAAP
jgi:hypothetical protein